MYTWRLSNRALTTTLKLRTTDSCVRIRCQTSRIFRSVERCVSYPTAIYLSLRSLTFCLPKQAVVIFVASNVVVFAVGDRSPNTPLLLHPVCSVDQVNYYTNKYLFIREKDVWGKLVVDLWDFNRLKHQQVKIKKKIDMKKFAR